MDQSESGNERGHASTQVRRTSRIIVFTLGAIFVLAALGKAWDPPAFAETVAFLLGRRPHTDSTSLALACAIIAFEFGLGSMLLLRCGIRGALATSIATLSLFSIALGILLVSPDAPACGCFGAGIDQHARASAALGIVRNLLFIAGAVWALRHIPSRVPAARRPVGLAMRCVRPGLTMIEVLISISVLALLIGLLAPSLGQARDRSAMIRSLSTHRQLLASIALYTKDNNDALPFLGHDRALGQNGLVDVHGFPLGNNYFTMQAWHWASLIVPTYFSPREAIELPGQQEYLGDVLGWPSHVVRTRFWMTYTAYAAPELWSEQRRSFAERRRLMRGMRLGEVMFPSQKGLLLDVGTGALIRAQRERGQTGLSIGVADGSAREINWFTTNPDLVIQPPDIQLFFAGPVMATRDGFHGRDFGVERTGTP